MRTGMAARRWATLLVAAAAAAPALADAERAKELATTVCAGCHGVDGNSPAPTFPKLAGMQREYLVKELNEYRSAGRKHLVLWRKRRNDTMVPTVSGLKPAEIEALAAYYSAQKPAPGQVKDARLAAAGRKIYRDGLPDAGVPNCRACHLEDGSGTARFPRVAGQHQEYAIEQMMQFRNGTRRNDVGRVMRLLAARMTEEQIRAVAEYMAGL